MEEPPKEEALPSLPYEPYIETIYDEETRTTFIVHIVCVCGLPMAKINENNDHACPHCDKLCKIEDCPACRTLNEFDFFNEYDYTGDGEEEGEDDADI